MTELTDDIKLRDLISKGLDEDKAEDIVTIDLRGKVPYADWMIVATGLNGRHLQSLAQKAEGRMKDAGFGDARFEGMTDGNWVIMDAGDVIVHLFRPAVRQFYRLEDLWQLNPPSRGK